MTDERQCSKLESDMKAEIHWIPLYRKKLRLLLFVDSHGDQTWKNVSTVRKRVMHCSSEDSDGCEMSHSEQLLIEEVFDKPISTNQGGERRCTRTTLSWQRLILRKFLAYISAGFYERLFIAGVYIHIYICVCVCVCLCVCVCVCVCGAFNKFPDFFGKRI